MKNYFANIFEDVMHKRSLTILSSITDEGILRQRGFTGYKMNIKKVPSRKFHRQKILREYIALQLK